MERRKTFRIPVNDDASCRLKTRYETVNCELLEESAGGYAVLAPSQRRLKPELDAILTTPRGVFTVRIAHISRVPNGIKVGLERTGEMETKNNASDSRKRTNRPSSTRNPLAPSVVGPLIVAIILLMVGAEYWIRTTGKNKVETTAVSFNRSEAVQRFNALRSLNGPSTTKTMRLSQKQQGKVIRVTVRALNELKILENSRGGVPDDELADLSMQVIYQATDEIHAMLNAQQKEVWSGFVNNRAKP
jgi:hypothetical protein